MSFFDEHLTTPTLRRPPTKALAITGLVLLMTCLLGVLMRWKLTGVVGLRSLNFIHWRHAHSHLGYFGVVFPVLWLMWFQLSRNLPSRRWLQLYAFAVPLSTFGFLRAGYGVEAIAGSTAVLVVWWVSAWQQRQSLRTLRSWLAIVPVGIVIATFCILMIAMTSRRAPAQAKLWVQTFLSLFLLTVVLPVWMERWRWPSPPWFLWVLAAVHAALFLGIGQGWGGMGWGLIAMGLWSLWSLSRPNATPMDLQFWWAGWALGAVLLGMKLLPNTHVVAIAGLHYALLGPFVLSALSLWSPAPLPRLWRALYTLSLLAMCVGILGVQWKAWTGWAQWTATFSTLLWLELIALGLWWFRLVRSSHTRSAS